MCAFFKALQSNQLLLDNLRKLNISNNRLDGDGSSELGIFLSKSKALIYLDMANTSPNYTNIVNKVRKKKANFKIFLIVSIRLQIAKFLPIWIFHITRLVRKKPPF